MLLSLASYAHTTNTDFISKFASGQIRSFVPGAHPPALQVPGAVRLPDPKQTKFFTYESLNGWNNQLLNLHYAIDIARLLNRTLIVPPFRWPRRRGKAAVSVGRILDLEALSRLVPVLVLR